MRLELTAPGAPGRLAQPGKVRAGWVDLLRAIGIILVVVGHAMGGIIDSGAVEASPWFRPVFAAIYTFHMPLLFFLTGLFVRSRVERDASRFRNGLLTSIAWPYLLWSTVQLIVIWAAGSLVNRPLPDILPALLSIPWAPPSQFWFLYGLFAFHLAALWTVRRLSGAMFLVVAMGVASLAQLDAMPPVAEEIMRMAPYYALGVVFGPALLHAAQPGRSTASEWLAICSAPVAIFVSMQNALGKGEGVWPHSADGIVSDVNGFQNFFAAAAAVGALVLLARRFAPAAPGWLLRCGELSMPIFVLHIIFMAGTRIAAVKLFGPIDGAVLLPLLVAVGVAGPIGVYLVANRAGFARALGF